MDNEKDLLSSVADLLECFSENEGTWFMSQWESYGISEDIKKMFCNAWENKYGNKNKIIKEFSNDEQQGLFAAISKRKKKNDDSWYNALRDE